MLHAQKQLSYFAKLYKETFPDIKFSVKSDTYKEGGAIHVNWRDGPNLKQVEAVGKRFESILC
ncbi:LPD29 domain-containing protein [Xylella fastidiosa]|uniref:LPD29 domain-containing protein n=1 Tax=Xylella fastidiosa TaxID=2371 RepID=UPI002DD4332A|nr:LPD29 domain-containing protein [Xylella fastidiosa]